MRKAYEASFETLPTLVPIIGEPRPRRRRCRGHQHQRRAPVPRHLPAAAAKLELADKAVEAGIQEAWELLSAGRLKVFDSCGAWFEEYRLYRRDDTSRIVKPNDYLMDCTYGQATLNPSLSPGSTHHQVGLCT